MIKLTVLALASAAIVARAAFAHDVPSVCRPTICSISCQCQSPVLAIQPIGNAGVMLSDGTTSLLVDLPYEPGAFGYEHYDPRALQPAGTVVSVITHHHRDHFDPALFVARASWRIVGPPRVTVALPADRVLDGDSVTAGAFAIIAVPTPHTDDHRSYRIRWRGRVLHFAGDTEDASTIPAEPRLDILFVTPWLSCASNWIRSVAPTRVVLYHQRADGSDPICGRAEVHEQGAILQLTPVPNACVDCHAEDGVHQHGSLHPNLL